MRTKVDAFVVIRVINILVSSFTFFRYYFWLISEIDMHISSKGILEALAVYSAVAFIGSGVGFTTLLIAFNKSAIRIKLLLASFILLLIVLMGVLIPFSLVVFMVIAVLVWVLSIKKIRDRKFDPSSIFASKIFIIIFLVFNIIWAIISMNI